MKRLRAAFFVLVGGVAGFFVLLAGVWLYTLRDSAPAQNDCAFKSIGKAEFQRLLAQAKEQESTVWPGLSNGIFWPSDRGINVPAVSFEKNLGRQLEDTIRQLAPPGASSNMQLAAAHAVMRSMGAVYLGVHDTPDLRQNGTLVSSKVHFDYLLPKTRFAPLCLTCLLWWNTTISIVFNHDIAVSTTEFFKGNLLFSNLKYTPKFGSLPKEACPAFPTGLGQ